MVCIRIERNFFGIRSCELWLTRNYFSFYSVLKTEREEIIFPFNPWAVWLLLSSWCGVHFLFSWCFVAVESDCTLLALQQNFHNFCSLVSTSVLLPHRSSFIKGCNPNLMKRLRGNSSLKKVRQRGGYVKKKKNRGLKREPYLWSKGNHILACAAAKYEVSVSQSIRIHAEVWRTFGNLF